MHKAVLTRIPEVVTFVLLAVFFAPICGWLFSCGCTHLWAGADKHCSIHDPARADCPWCATPKGQESLRFLYQVLPFTVIFISALSVVWLMRRKTGAHLLRECFIGTLAAFVAMALLGKVYAWILEYPTYRF